MIAIIDYRMGNLRSVQKGFEHAGVTDVRVTGDPAVVGAADGVVLPGVGAFRDAAANLAAGGMREALLAKVASGTPFLGICLGMQLLADVGYEDGEWEGLGLVPGACTRLSGDVKIPHIGWNTVEYARPSLLFDGVPESTAFYFVHSYRLEPDSDSVIIGSTGHGTRFAAAIGSGNVHAVQFHPEKSSSAGLRVLGNFGRMVERA